MHKVPCPRKTGPVRGAILGVTLLDRSRQMQLQLSLDPKRANIYFSTAAQPKAELLYGNVRPTAVQFFSMAIID
jgi:hypothetical protein